LRSTVILFTAAQYLSAQRLRRRLAEETAQATDWHERRYGL
jgi:hypothetical protein